MSCLAARAISLAVVGICGCGDVTDQSVPDPAASLNEPVFRCLVEPILARQCSFNACHGNAISALRVYTPGKLRAMPAATVDDLVAPLTDAEQHANFESASGFSFQIATAEDDWLLRKPLPANAGGYEHKGGAIYSGTNDSQYVAIRSWLTGAGACP